MAEDLAKINYFFVGLRFLELRRHINQVDMTHEQRPAAISLQAKVIQDFLSFLALLDSFRK